MNEKIVMVSNGYDLIDGRNAYQSDIKSLTLGEPMLDENKKMQIAAQIWKTGKDGELFLAIGVFACNCIAIVITIKYN